MIEAIFAVLNGLSAWHGDVETTEARTARLWTIANSSYAAAHAATCTGPWSDVDVCEVVWHGDVKELVALHIVIGRFESHFAEHVGAGRCRAWECDRLRARHYFQTQQGPRVSKALWAEMKGTEYFPTMLAAYAASSVLGQGLDRCKSIKGAISFYARSECSWQGTPPRLQAYQRVLTRLRNYAGPKLWVSGQSEALASR